MTDREQEHAEQGHQTPAHRDDGEVGSSGPTPAPATPRASGILQAPNHGDNALEALLDAQIDRVDRRVTGGHDVYAAERADARVAAKRVHVLRRTLGLGRFLGPVGPAKSKPQFLLLFDSPRGPVVLKTYGRIRPGEARVQQLWRRHGVRVVEVLDAGDHPTSWLLMAPLESDPVATDLLAGPELGAVTAELAALMAPAHSVGSAMLVDTAGFDAGMQHLVDAITTHLGGVLVALQRHGYLVREDWNVLVQRFCTSHGPTLLHGDLGGGNVVRDVVDGQLRILDSAGYVGPAEFDAARWAARTGGSGGSEDVLTGWLRSEPALDEALARALLGLELLMEAGVREIVKQENGRPSGFPDVTTTALLASADRLLDDAAARP